MFTLDYKYVYYYVWPAKYKLKTRFFFSSAQKCPTPHNKKHPSICFNNYFLCFFVAWSCK